MSDGIPMPAKPAKVYAVPARPGLVNDMREWELIGTTTWMPDTIAEQIDEALDGYRRAQDAHTQTWSFGTIPAAPWLLLMLGFKVRGLSARRPRMKDRARRRRNGYTRTGARR